MEEEYEIIPTSPIRRLEKRISEVERTSTPSEVRRLIEQIVELIKSNQRVIDDIVKSNFELRAEIAKVPGKVDQLLSSMKEFMDMLKASAAEETVSAISKDVMEPVVNKIQDLVELNKKSAEATQAMISSLDAIDKRMKRLSTQLTVYRR